MENINDIFDLYLDGEIIGEPCDTPETLNASRTLEQYIEDNTAGAVASRLNKLVAEYHYHGMAQGFAAGFQCALALIASGEIRAGV